MYQYKTLASSSLWPLKLGRLNILKSLNGYFLPWYGGPLSVKQVTLEFERSGFKTTGRVNLYGERIVTQNKTKFLVHQWAPLLKSNPAQMLLFGIEESLLQTSNHGFIHALACKDFKGKARYRIKRHLAYCNHHSFASSNVDFSDAWDLCQKFARFGPPSGLRYFGASDILGLDPQMLVVSPDMLASLKDIDYDTLS